MKAIDKPNTITTLQKHLFVADWQNKRFEDCKSHIQHGDVLAVYNFAQNYTMMNQDAIKSDHYAKKQITVHPIPCYYRQDNQLRRELIIMLSDNLTHDAYAVSAFRKKMVLHLRSKGVDVAQLIEWCDGAGNQYKFVNAFVDVTEAAQELGLKIIRCFYGSEHGKGESDAKTGCLKTALARHIIGTGAIIQNADDIKLFGEKHMARDQISKLKNVDELVNTTRTFHVVNNHSRPVVKPAYVSVSGTNKIHCVESGTAMELKKRSLACFCYGCRSAGKCGNSLTVGDWERILFKYYLLPYSTQN